MYRRFTEEAETELELLLKSRESEDFIKSVDIKVDNLRKFVKKTALQGADERGELVKRSDVQDVWKMVTEWGDLTPWKNDLKKAIEDV